MLYKKFPEPAAGRVPEIFCCEMPGRAGHDGCVNSVKAGGLRSPRLRWTSRGYNGMMVSVSFSVKLLLLLGIFQISVDHEKVVAQVEI